MIMKDMIFLAIIILINFGVLIFLSRYLLKIISFKNVSFYLLNLPFLIFYLSLLFNMGVLLYQHNCYGAVILTYCLLIVIIISCVPQVFILLTLREEFFRKEIIYSFLNTFAFTYFILINIDYLGLYALLLGIIVFTSNIFLARAINNEI